MKPIDRFEYPKELQEDFRKAKRLEWITIFYLLSTAALVMATMGNSQAMKTAWFEDILSLTPAISFLVASRVFHKAPNKNFPYGYHRVVSVAYLCSAVALFGVGAFLIFDSASTLVKQEHPTIGMKVIFGHQVWLGYLMMAVMVYGTIPALILGRMKLPLAEKLHEKNLYTDADMNKADWMTAAAAILGVAGIGMGWWWADSVAALIIAFDIIKDGYTNLKQAVFDIMDERPKTVNDQQDDPLLQEVKEVLERETWIKEHAFRMREEGHIYLGEGFVVPKQEQDLVDKIEQLTQKVEGLSWRIQEFVVMPVRELPLPNGQDGEE
ncbi:cation diffusion facilitator family transporter [Rufibacter immobilis]|uniref:Cation diffusion facilitator family transporter n=1 Tax=Rufibacter immobilis TaxID=1348778 RepID=A0A3M9N433_9BACT|nr:cation diffusion facilitator family transporter [Rufibacter immobilis]RNI31943.1 cation diffusion facilitator family transporter [Rufibacter immobilis]